MATKELSGQLGMATPLGELLGSSRAELEAEFADYAAMGVDWVRTDFWWHLAQPTATGGFDWSLMDRVVEVAAKYDIKIIAELNGYPTWVDRTMATPATQEAFARYAAAAAAHFGDRVDHWEIYNEPNMAGISPASYTKILQGAYDAIKAVDAGDVVILGGTAPAPSTANGIWGAVDYLQGIYANGGKGHFDAVAFHPYTYPLMPNSPEPWNGWRILEDGIRQTMVANGDGDMQIWLTELGAPTAGGRAAVTQAQQAEMIEQAVARAGELPWLGPILWYSYKDRGGSTTDTENWFGLIGPNGERKEAYATFVAIATTQEATFTTRNFTGTTADETIVGNDQDNGIWAGHGNDVVRGGRGNDLIVGQWGDDTLWGGAGADRFDFNDHRLMGRDVIRDFAAGDRIDLRDVDANVTVAGDQAFTFIGTNWLAAAGDLGFYRDPAGHTSVQGDVNGDGIFDFSIRVDGHYAFTANDFLL